MKKLVLGTMLLALLAIPPAAQAVTVRVVAQDFDFESDDQLEVILEVEDAQGLTGLEFSLVYPSDLLAVDQPSTHELGGLFSHAFVNHDADSSDLPAGSRRIGIALSVAVPVASPAGTLVTLSFPLRCSDFSGDWPAGRPVALEVQDEAAWTAQAGELPVPTAVSVEDVTVTVDCTTVPVRDRGFSTLKMMHTGRGGSR
jgi:hypothetical protein